MDITVSEKMEDRKLSFTKIEKAITVIVRSQYVPLNRETFEGREFPVQESYDLTLKDFI